MSKEHPITVPPAAAQHWSPSLGFRGGNAATLGWPGWIRACLSPLTFCLRCWPAANGAEGRSLQPFLGNVQRRKTLQGHGGAHRESRETHGCLPAHSLFQGGSSDPAWHPGVLHRKGHPCPRRSSLAPSTPRSPSTGYGPDLTLTHLPCPDEFWTPLHWEFFRLGKPHLEKAFSMAMCRGP